LTAQTKTTSTEVSAALHYSRAPILEAALRIKMVESIPAAAVGAMHPLLAESYPTKQQVFDPLEEETSDGVRLTSKFVGYNFSADDGKRYVSARTDGITFSQLNPYDRWETFSAEGKRVWEAYRSVNISGVESISLRYINRIEIRVPVTDLRKYLRTLPEIAPELPHMIKSFLMRLELPTDHGIDLIVMQGTVKTPKPDTVALMLDIEVNAPAESLSDDEMWIRFEALRVQKNETFEHCITDGLRDLIR
jgi:uncharacterized protein (TIGR04255 family)